MHFFLKSIPHVRINNSFKNICTSNAGGDAEDSIKQARQVQELDKFYVIAFIRDPYNLSYFQRFKFNNGITTQEIRDFLLFKQYFLHL